MTTPPDDLPPLDLVVRPPAPDAWQRIVARARRRRRRTTSLAVTAVLLVAATPAALSLPRDSRPTQVAHEAAQTYDGICAGPYDRPAPTGDRIVRSFRYGTVLVSPAPADSRPAVDADVLRQRAQARGVAVSPGSQLRWGLVRRLSDNGRIYQPQLRWVLTTCGRPIPLEVPGTPQPVEPGRGTAARRCSCSPTAGPAPPRRTAPCSAACATSGWTAAAPAGNAVVRSFHVGELRVTRPPEGAVAGRRGAALDTLERRGYAFPGTQVRLGLVQPLHRPGAPRLAWVATTCGLDGQSVRPRLPGVVSEALVLDARGRVVEEHRSGAESEALALIPGRQPCRRSCPPTARRTATCAATGRTRTRRSPRAPPPTATATCRAATARPTPPSSSCRARRTARRPPCPPSSGRSTRTCTRPASRGARSASCLRRRGPRPPWCAGCSARGWPRSGPAGPAADQLEVAGRVGSARHQRDPGVLRRLTLTG